MSTDRSFWVRWSGVIANENGEFDSTDPSLKAFLRALSQEFTVHPLLSQAAVICPGDGTISLSSVITAADSGQAVNKARDSFEEAIEKAGGSSELPDGNHPSWSVRELIRLIEASVKDLAPAA